MGSNTLTLPEGESQYLTLIGRRIFNLTNEKSSSFQALGSVDNKAFEGIILTTFKLNELQNIQRDALSALLKRRDVFVSIKTGGGKSLCMIVYKTSCSASVVSPLCNFLNDLIFHRRILVCLTRVVLFNIKFYIRILPMYCNDALYNAATDVQIVDLLFTKFYVLLDK